MLRTREPRKLRYLVVYSLWLANFTLIPESNPPTLYELDAR